MLNITSAQTQGPRPYQEDYTVVHNGDNGATVLAIFDGHGGEECANKAANSLSTIYDEYSKGKYGDSGLLNLFAKLNEYTQFLDSGSTASIVIIDVFFTKAEVGVLGDSPVYINNNDGFFLSDEHNVRTNKAEVEALLKRGGAITWDGYYAYDPQDFSLATKGRALQMTRALGNVHLNRILDRRPAISSVPLNESSVVLVASDGLFDPSHMDGDQSFKDIQHMLSYDNVGAEQLVTFRQRSGIGDNVSAIVVRK